MLSKPKYECVEFISKHRGGVTWASAYNNDKNALSNICTTSSSPQKDDAARLTICCCIFSFSTPSGDTMHSTLLQQWADIFPKTRPTCECLLSKSLHGLVTAPQLCSTLGWVLGSEAQGRNLIPERVINSMLKHPWIGPNSASSMFRCIIVNVK